MLTLFAGMPANKLVINVRLSGMPSHSLRQIVDECLLQVANGLIAIKLIANLSKLVISRIAVSGFNNKFVNHASLILTNLMIAT